MIMLNNIIGFQSELEKESDIRDFFAFIASLLGSKMYVHSNHSFVVSEIGNHLPSSFTAQYFYEMSQPSFWTESCSLYLYSSEYPFEEIETYSDFVDSKCEIILLLYDVCYLEVYCKDPTLLRIFMDRIKSNGAIVEEKIEGKDSRTTLQL